MTLKKDQTEALFARLQSFYSENSFGLLTATATVTNITSGNNVGAQGAFRMPKALSAYANGINSDYVGLVKDAIAISSPTVDFSKFDHFVFYHSGPGSETSNNPTGFIWSVYLPPTFLPRTSKGFSSPQGSQGPGDSGIVEAPTINGTDFPGMIIVPETESQGVNPLGVACHEYGHQLGLPDLYNTDTGGSAVGGWTVMDSGLYEGSPPGSKPAHQDAWSKQFLGFSQPQIINTNKSVPLSLPQAETTRNAFFRIPIAVSSVGGSNEYYLLEYRRTSGATYDYDTGLPGQGLIIWHIDDSIALDPNRLANDNINNGVPHLGVALVPADNIAPSSNGGDGNNPWIGPAIFATPYANAFNGNDSGIQVLNISGSGTLSMSLTINNLFSNPAIVANTTAGDSSVVVTGGQNGYVNPSLSEKASIAFRPASSATLSVKIYSMAGDLVYQTTFSGTANQQGLVVWDGKNQDGGVVSSGIYLLHLVGGGIDKTKKIAIVK